MPRPGKIRKEIYLSSADMTMIRDVAKRYALDATAAMRMLMRLGFEKLTGSPYNVDDKQCKRD